MPTRNTLTELQWTSQADDATPAEVDALFAALDTLPTFSSPDGSSRPRENSPPETESGYRLYGLRNQDLASPCSSSGTTGSRLGRRRGTRSGPRNRASRGPSVGSDQSGSGNLTQRAQSFAARYAQGYNEGVAGESLTTTIRRAQAAMNAQPVPTRGGCDCDQCRIFNAWFRADYAVQGNQAVPQPAQASPPTSPDPRTQGPSPRRFRFWYDDLPRWFDQPTARDTRSAPATEGRGAGPALSGEGATGISVDANGFVRGGPGDDGESTDSIRWTGSRR